MATEVQYNGYTDLRANRIGALEREVDRLDVRAMQCAERGDWQTREMLERMIDQACTTLSALRNGMEMI